VGRTVEGDLAFGPENLCLPPLEIQKCANMTLDEMGLRNRDIALQKILGMDGSSV